MGDNLIHFPIANWLKKHQAIEDGLRQQLDAKDQQLEALTDANAQLEADYEHLQNEYADLRERQDRTPSSADVVQTSNNCRCHEHRVETSEQEVQTDDFDLSPSTPSTEYSLAPAAPTRVRDNPEKLLKWGQKHKDREEKLREELSATEFKLSKWMKEHSYLKGAAEAHQANVVKLEEKLRNEESAKNAAFMELQSERQKLARMTASATALQQQLDAERHTAATMKSRIEELQADFHRQIDVKDKIIAKLLEDKNALQSSLKKVSVEKPKHRSSSAHSTGSTAEVPSSTSDLGSSQSRQPRKADADRSSHTMYPKKSRRDDTFSKPSFSKYSGRPFGRNSEYAYSRRGPQRPMSPVRHTPFVETAPASSQAGPGAILRIANLDPAITNEALEKVIQRFGPITIFYIEDRGGEEESANSAVVKFAQETDAKEALRKLNGVKLAGMRIAVTMHKQAP